MPRTAPRPSVQTRSSRAAAASRRTYLLTIVAGFALVAAFAVGGTTVLSAHGGDAGEATGTDVRASGPDIHQVDPVLAAALEEVYRDMAAEREVEIPDALADREAEEPTSQVQGAQTEQPAEGSGVFQQGTASWYGPGFAGNTTANGETYDPSQLTAAHRTLPFGTQVRVTNQNTGSSVVVRINDRGPYAGDRIIDLSEAAADQIGMRGSGLAPVTLEIVG